MWRSRLRVAPLGRIEDRASERHELDRMSAYPTAESASSIVQPNILKCNAAMCRANNTIKCYGKQFQLLTMMATVLIPVAVLAWLTSKMFVNTFISYTSSDIRKTIIYSVELGEVVHSLQKERDMSALYISKISPVSKSLLLQRYPETDRSIEKLTFWTTLNRFEFQSKYKFLFYLNKHRYELDTLGQTVTRELEAYTTLIRIFIKWLYEAVPENESGFIWRSLAAYLDIIIVKENIGLERALGMVFYAKGEFPSVNVYLWFLESQAVSNSTFESARRNSDLVYTLYNKNIQGNETTLRALGKMRAEIRRNELGGLGSIEMTECWYNKMTAYTDLLLQMQSQLAEEITGLLNIRQAINFDKLITISVVFVCFFIFCPFSIYAVYKLNNEIHQYYTFLVKITKSLCSETKRRLDALNQSLPTSVTESVINHVNVDNKLFEAVTILNTSISGLDKLTTRNSPSQIVELLNRIDKLIESQVILWDVHRMTSQNDGYMIVSGLPINNGLQHAEDICLLALHLRNEINKLIITHLPIKKLEFRIGIHSGPVVAGLIGTKPLNYRLFGETVALAHKMETLGLGGNIHISQPTQELLDSFEGFNTEMRRDGHCQMDVGMQELLNGRAMDTYWLVGHVDVLNQLRGDDSDTNDDDAAVAAAECDDDTVGADDMDQN